MLLLFDDLVGNSHRLYSVQVAQHCVDVFLGGCCHAVHHCDMLLAGLQRGDCSSLHRVGLIRVPSSSHGCRERCFLELLVAEQVRWVVAARAHLLLLPLLLELPAKREFCQLIEPFLV